MISVLVLIFVLGLFVGLLLGQWSIYRYYRKKTGREFYPDVCKLSRGESLIVGKEK